jgi:hypothetical protein
MHAYAHRNLNARISTLKSSDAPYGPNERNRSLSFPAPHSRNPRTRTQPRGHGRDAVHVLRHAGAATAARPRLPSSHHPPALLFCDTFLIQTARLRPRLQLPQPPLAPQQQLREPAVPARRITGAGGLLSHCNRCVGRSPGRVRIPRRPSDGPGRSRWQGRAPGPRPARLRSADPDLERAVRRGDRGAMPRPPATAGRGPLTIDRRGSASP